MWLPCISFLSWDKSPKCFFTCYILIALFLFWLCRFRIRSPWAVGRLNMGRFSPVLSCATLKRTSSLQFMMTRWEPSSFFRAKKDLVGPPEGSAVCHFWWKVWRAVSTVGHERFLCWAPWSGGPWKQEALSASCMLSLSMSYFSWWHLQLHGHATAVVTVIHTPILVFLLLLHS